MGLAMPMTACASSQAKFCLAANETPADAPFALSVELSQTQVRVGDRVNVTFHLLNQTDRPAGACPPGWETFQVINTATKVNRGMIDVAFDGVSLADVFRLPPHSTLTWVRAIEIPDVGSGEAVFVGRLSSSCWLWHGEVKSEPVKMQLLSGEPASN